MSQQASQPTTVPAGAQQVFPGTFVVLPQMGPGAPLEHPNAMEIAPEAGPSRGRPEVRGQKRKQATTVREQDAPSRKRATPTETKVEVAKMVRAIGMIYGKMCLEVTLNNEEERELLQNSLVIERMILSAFDDRRTEYLEKQRTQEATINIKDPAMTGGTLYKRGATGWEAVDVKIRKDRIKEIVKEVAGDNPYNILVHIMIWHSNLNDSCYQRNKTLRRAGLESSLISTLAGSTLPRRAGGAGAAIKGTGTLAIEAIRFIRKAAGQQSFMRGEGVKEAWFRLMNNFRSKLTNEHQRRMIEQVRDTRKLGEAQIEDIQFIARSCLILRPSVAHKSAYPMCVYYQGFKAGGPMETATEYSLVGWESWNLLQSVRVRSCMMADEDPRDKSQMAWTALHAAPYEDLKVNSFLSGKPFKKRGQLKCKGFHVSAAMRPKLKGVELLDVSSRYWAPLTKSGGNNVAPGGGSKGQISCQPTFSVERQMPLNREAVARMFTATETEGRDMDYRRAILMTLEGGVKSNSVSFSGRKAYDINDKEGKVGVSMPAGNTMESFFYGDSAEDYEMS